MAQNNQEEVDLFLVIDKLKDFYHWILACFYRAVQFILKHWIVLLILLVGGYFAGYFLQKSAPPKREARLIVQNNFNSSSYVYEAVQLLNVKYQQGDRTFLERYGFDPEATEITEITIEPIVNIMDLLEMHEANDRNLDSYIANIEADEDLLLSEAFYPEYSYHRIIIKTSGNNKAILQKVLDYLNSNELLNKIKTVAVEETIKHLERNNTSIDNIDAIFDEYAGKNSKEANPSQVYVKTQENNNLHQLIEKKQELIEENEELKEELLKYDTIVTLINYPELYRTSSILDNKKLFLPLILVFSYILFFIIRAIYLKGKKYSQPKQA